MVNSSELHNVIIVNYHYVTEPILTYCKSEIEIKLWNSLPPLASTLNCINTDRIPYADAVDSPLQILDSVLRTETLQKCLHAPAPTVQRFHIHA